MVLTLEGLLSSSKFSEGKPGIITDDGFGASSSQKISSFVIAAIFSRSFLPLFDHWGGCDNGLESTKLVFHYIELSTNKNAGK